MRDIRDISNSSPKREVPSLRGGGGEPPIAPNHATPTHDTPPRTKDSGPRTQDVPPPPEPDLLLDGDGGFEISNRDPLAPSRPLLFTPSLPATSQLLEALSDPTLSLLAIARLYNTSLDALTAWMDRPDIRDQLRAIHTATIRRNQLVAATRMTKVILACEEIIDGYLDEEHNNPIERTDARAIEQRRRARETARKAASLIARISRCSTPPPRWERGLGGGQDSRTTTLAPAYHVAAGNVAEERDSYTAISAPSHAGEVPSLRGGGGEPPESQHPDALDTHIASIRTLSVSEQSTAPTTTSTPAPTTSRHDDPKPSPSEARVVGRRSEQHGDVPSNIPGTPSSPTRPEGPLIPLNHKIPPTSHHAPASHSSHLFLPDSS